MRALIFPGQGSQSKGMGADLFDKIPEFLAVERHIDELLGYSLRKTCLENTDNRLLDTRYAQPCLFVVNALHFYSSRAAGDTFSFLAGHSLGEYNALLAAGAFDLLTGVSLVKQRGALMAQARSGRMAAVGRMTPEQIGAVLRDKGLGEVTIANYNTPMQTVISGPREQIMGLGPAFQAAGAALYYPLPVSAAFHSPFMRDAARDFKTFLEGVMLRPPRAPVISNVTGRLYPADVTGAGVADLLVQQITQPVRWVDSVRYMRQQGVTTFAETGPGNVLTKLVAQIE